MAGESSAATAQQPMRGRARWADLEDEEIPGDCADTTADLDSSCGDGGESSAAEEACSTRTPSESAEPYSPARLGALPCGATGSSTQARDSGRKAQQGGGAAAWRRVSLEGGKQRRGRADSLAADSWTADSWAAGAWWAERSWADESCAEVSSDGWWREGAHAKSRWGGLGSGDQWHSSRVQRKSQCQLTIGIEEERAFRVVRRLLGAKGAHVKAIAEESGARLRLRGRGSGFKEGPAYEESTDPLMLCISAADADGYLLALHLTRLLLEEVFEAYRTFCAESGRPAPCPDLRVDVHEGPRDGSF